MKGGKLLRNILIGFDGAGSFVRDISRRRVRLGWVFCFCRFAK